MVGVDGLSVRSRTVQLSQWIRIAILSDMNRVQPNHKRARRLTFISIGLIAFVAGCGLVLWVFSDPDRRELARRILINFKSGGMRGLDGKVIERE